MDLSKPYNEEDRHWDFEEVMVPKEVKLLRLQRAMSLTSFDSLRSSENILPKVYGKFVESFSKLYNEFSFKVDRSETDFVITVSIYVEVTDKVKRDFGKAFDECYKQAIFNV